eukprot:2868950-Amphidinium_carterae.1
MGFELFFQDSERATDVLYGERMSIYQRFEGLQGAMLYSKVISVYADNTMKKLKYFNRDGEKLLFRHPLNNRRQD